MRQCPLLPWQHQVKEDLLEGGVQSLRPFQRRLAESEAVPDVALYL